MLWSVSVVEVSVVESEWGGECCVGWVVWRVSVVEVSVVEGECCGE